MTETNASSGRGWRRVLGGIALACGIAAAPAMAQPVKLTIGIGEGTDYTLELMPLRKELTPGQGRDYTLDIQMFRGSDARNKAYLSGALEGATGSAAALLNAAASGLELTIVASVTQKPLQGSFHPQFVVLADSPIKSVADLKGKTIGINGFRSTIQLLAVLALQKAGLNPDRDVTFAPAGFGVQATALRTGKLDAAILIQPFYEMENRKGGIRTLFAGNEALPHDTEGQVLFFHPAFLQKNGAVVRSFLKDFVAVVRYYNAQTKQARQDLLDANLVKIPGDIFLALQDYHRASDARVSIEALRVEQDAQIAAGYQKQAIDPAKIVDLSYLPAQ